MRRLLQLQPRGRGGGSGPAGERGRRAARCAAAGLSRPQAPHGHFLRRCPTARRARRGRSSARPKAAWTRKRHRPGPPAPLLLATARPGPASCPRSAPADAGLTRILRLISVPISMALRRPAGSALRSVSLTWSPPRAPAQQPPPLRLRSRALRVSAPAGPESQCKPTCVRMRMNTRMRAPEAAQPLLWRPLLASPRTAAYAGRDFTCGRLRNSVCFPKPPLPRLALLCIIKMNYMCSRKISSFDVIPEFKCSFRVLLEWHRSRCFCQSLSFLSWEGVPARGYAW